MAEVVELLVAGRRHGGGPCEVVRAPFDGAALAVVPIGDPGLVDEAVAAAHASLAEPMPAWERAEILDRVATQLDSDSERFARIIAAEAAKPIRAARTEVERAAATFWFAAGVARSLTGQTIPMDAHRAGAGLRAYTQPVPRGVLAAITPFNFPLNLVAHKLAPAIAAGCPVVLKPAPGTPLSALALAEVCIGAGLDPARLSVVHGYGPVGAHLVSHAQVAVVSFTGSPEVGWAIARAAERKHVLLELGNASPVIVAADAELARAAARIVTGGFGYAGQSCISVQRVYAHETIRAELEERVVAGAEALVAGDPHGEATDVSCLINPEATARVEAMIADAVAGGATVACGGVRDPGAPGVLRPTVLTGADDTMTVMAEEVFGPVVSVAGYTQLTEAIARANTSRFGLQAAVFTESLSTAMTAVEGLEFGGVCVNEMPTLRLDQMPYGGVRDSGNTKEGPAAAVRELVHEKLVILGSPGA